MLMDILVLGVGWLVVASALGPAVGLGHRSSPPAGGALALTGGSLPAVVVYFGALDGSRQGQTIGKMTVGICVRDMRTGASIGVGRGLLRSFLRLVLYVPVLPGVVSDLMPLWTTAGQTLADMAAGSVVTVKPVRMMYSVPTAGDIPWAVTVVPPVTARSGPRRRWWAPAVADQPGPPVTAARAYLEVAGVFLAFFGAPIGLAAASLAGDLGTQSNLGWATAGPEGFQQLAEAGLALAVTVLLCH